MHRLGEEGKIPFRLPRRRGRGLRLARTFVPDLLEQLFNRRVSRFISHDDQNLRRGIARDVRTGCREPWGCTPSVGGNLDRCAGS